MSNRSRKDDKKYHDENSESSAKGYRLNVFIAVVVVLTLVTACIGVYFQFTTMKLEREIKGMTEYEVCQYAVKNYGMKMVEDMGCLDNDHVIESLPEKD